MSYRKWQGMRQERALSYLIENKTNNRRPTPTAPCGFYPAIPIPTTIIPRPAQLPPTVFAIAKVRPKQRPRLSLLLPHPAPFQRHRPFA